MTSRWIREWFTARAGVSERVPPKPLPNAMCARRVLVEQRVVVDAAGLADAGRRVDERDLAETTPRPVGVEEVGDEVAIFVGVGLEPNEPPLRELAAEPVDQAAAEREGERAAEGPGRAAWVRAREDLLRRHVRRDALA